MTNECPKCGKPVRLGARYCGFCGYMLNKADPGVKKPADLSQAGRTSPKHQQPPEVSLGFTTCPYCGKANRPGVKFCASCGKQLTPVPPPPAPPSLPLKKDKIPKGKRPRIVSLGFLVGWFVIICASLVAIAYRFGFLDTILPSETFTEVAVGNETITNTPIESTQTPSSTPEPTRTETPTSTITPSETSAPTITNTPTPKVVFEDDFTQGLEKWQTWENRPVDIGEGLLPPQIILDQFLDLKGFNYDEVGVTSILTFTLVSGMVIEFEAEVDNPLTEPLYFDWYPGDESRPLDELGPIFLEINNTEAIFHYQSNGNEIDCPVPLHDPTMRTYRISFGQDWKVTFFIGSNEIDEVCKGVIDQPDQLFGRITFSGFGLIDRIAITQSMP